MAAIRASEPIDLDPEVGGRGPVEPPRRPRLPVLLVLGAVVALVIGAVVADDRDVEVSVDQEQATTTTEADRRTPEPGSFPAPVALGGPTDGKESVGLPVKAEPSTGLVDGQEVTVTGTGFPPGVSVGVVMCTKEAGRDHGARGVDACNIGHFAQAETNSDGVAVATFSVRRLVVLDGQEVDCASEAQRCLIGMGMLSDYDTSGGVLVDFDPTVPLPDPPTATVEPSTGLVDGQEVTVSVTGLVPGTQVGATVCTTDGGACFEAALPETVDDTGAATFDTRVWRVFGSAPPGVGAGGTNVDCAVVPCSLAVWGEAVGGRALPQVGLSFLGGPIDRVPLTLEVTSTGPYRPGDVITVELPDLPVGASAEVLLCSGEQCSGTGFRQDPLPGGGVRVSLRAFSPGEESACVDGPCRLTVLASLPPGTDQPPLLLPEPVEVEIVG
ncbi:MAG TPA: neocarzinostatin apoprotein domain-containing protein [Acidimicrobiales bacterium]|nr:neocarzinostatin apoprotein domain-containing protein [Acidimicrobiales bacterium]